MNKKFVFFCFFVVMTLVVFPVVSSYTTIKELSSVQDTADEKQGSTVQEKPETTVITGYLLIHTSTYSPNIGFHPYPGANVSVRGFLYSYTGSTDDQGDCLLKVHTNLLRAKMYFVKISIVSQDRLVTKRDSVFIEPRQIIYEEYLFIVL
jgi:hypothetical protein